MIDKNDKTNLDYIRGLTDPNSSDMDLIFYYFNKYVDRSIMSYRTDCECSSGIRDIYYRLMRWYSGNINNFQ